MTKIRLKPNLPKSLNYEKQVKKIAIGLILFSGIVVLCRKEIPYKVLVTKWELTEWHLAIKTQSEAQDAVQGNAKIFELRSDDKAANTAAACVSPIRAYMPSDSLVNVSVVYGQFLATLQIYNRKEASLARCAESNVSGRKSVKQQFLEPLHSFVSHPVLSLFQAVKVATYHKTVWREGIYIESGA